MTYKQLRDILNNMSQEELSRDVTALVIDAGEFVPVDGLVYADKTDVLDVGYPYLMV